MHHEDIYHYRNQPKFNWLSCKSRAIKRKSVLWIKYYLLERLVFLLIK